MNDLFLKIVGTTSPLEVMLIVSLGVSLYLSLTKQMNGLGQRIDNVEQRLSKRIDESQQEIKAINSRIDKLYDLMLDLYQTLFKRNAA